MSIYIHRDLEEEYELKTALSILLMMTVGMIFLVIIVLVILLVIIILVILLVIIILHNQRRQFLGLGTFGRRRLGAGHLGAWTIRGQNLT